MDHRRFPRYEADEGVRIICLTQPRDTFAGRLENISPFGVRLACPRNLPVGSLIKVELDEAILLGEVIYCQSQGQEYLTGLEVEEIVYQAELAVVQGNIRKDLLPGEKTGDSPLRPA